MPEFAYKATDDSGRIITGTAAADDEKSMVKDLHQQGFIPIRITPLGKTGFGGFSRESVKGLFSRPGSRDVLHFTQDLAVLLDAGLPVDRALSILTTTTGSAAFRKVVQDILNDVKGGSYLSDALARHPKIFSRFHVGMTRAGESGGVLGPVLERMSAFLESTQELKDYVRSAMIYPLFLVGVGGVSIIILMTFVLPRFAVIFADMGQAVPLAARLLLGFSEFFRSYFLLIAGVLAAAVYLLNRYSRTEAGRYRLDRYKLEIPVMRDVVKNLETARFARTLGTLMKSGVPILQALALVRQVIVNRVIADSLNTVHDRVKEGDKLSGPLEASRKFPILAVKMITVGEETGKLDEMLLRVGDNYDKLLRNDIKKLVSLLEPVMILIMGVVVGFIVISMLTAIFSMNEIPF